MSEDFYIWQDREVRCDGTKQTLMLRKGEESFDTINHIEDSRANNGEIGTFIFTNLRLIWLNNSAPERNLSIGYDTIEELTEKEYESKIKGNTKAIFIKSKSGSQRYQFSFNSVSESSPNLYNALNNILKIYDSGRLYRDLKFKGKIMNFKEKKLDLLLDEEISGKYKNISFVSSDQNYFGTFITSNIRIVWFCNNVENFNLSIPWIQISSINLQENEEYGKILIIKSQKLFGGNSYPFFSNDQKVINNLINEVLSLKKIYQSNPILGIDIRKLVDNNQFEKQKKNPNNEINTNSKKDNEKKKSKHDILYENLLNNMNDDDEIVDNNYINETANIYLLNDNKSDQVVLSDIVYNEELGLAVQKLPENVTIDSLWKIIN